MSSELQTAPSSPGGTGVPPVSSQPSLHVIGSPPAPQPALVDEPVIAARGLGKCYQIYDKPVDRLKQAFFRWKRRYYREFWAIRNVTFEVRRGDSLGILGKNGSGKSTLLQLIAGTLTPSEGEVAVRGRVAAMLELGSGFNPEFTGKENVFLYGSVLGVTRREMENRYDAIAAFADIGDFLDQPLKTYSSGMQARLAFAVAFSIDPDVLIVDEILAVGDVGFQARCMARLRELRDAGLTMLFVSHSPDAVRSVCQRGLFLDRGQVRYVGAAEPATDQYLAHMREETNRDALKNRTELAKPVPFQNAIAGHTRYGSGHVQIQRVEVRNAVGEPCRAFQLGDTITLEAELKAHADVDNLSLSFLIRDFTGVDLTGTTSHDERAKSPPMRAGDSVVVRASFASQLRAGNFGICLAVNRVTQRDYSDNVLFDQVDGVAGFVVVGRPERPVHYKFHQPVTFHWGEVTRG